MSAEEYFAKMQKDSRNAATNHRRSIIHNLLERVRVGIQESGDDGLEEDFADLEKIIDQLVEEALPYEP